MAKGTKNSAKSAESGYRIGRSDFAKISAVEGIELTPAMDADFRDFDRKGLPPEERRVIIARKYGARKYGARKSGKAR